MLLCGFYSHKFINGRFGRYFSQYSPRALLEFIVRGADKQKSLTHTLMDIYGVRRWEAEKLQNTCMIKILAGAHGYADMASGHGPIKPVK